MRAVTPTLKQLKYLCAIAEHRHFGHAADACHISQSTLSASIRELEENLGVVLVERSNKRVMLTGVGKDVVQRSRDVLTAVSDLVAATRATKIPLSGELHLGVIPTVAPFLLPKLLKKLRKNHPDCHLYIREELSKNLVEAMQLGELDVLLLALPFPAEGVETRHLFDDEFLLAYYDQHPISQVKSLRTRDLKGQDLLLLEDGHCLRDHALEACQLRDKEFSVPYQATSLNTIVQMVANGIGITLLPQMAVEAKILSGVNITTKHFENRSVHRSIGLMWRKNSPRKPEFHLLAEIIEALFNPEP